MPALNRSPEDFEAEVREFLVELMPIELAPSLVRLAFHDAGTYDQASGTGGAHGTVHLTEELRRADNTGWGQECMALLEEARLAYPSLSWADLIALGGTAAVQKTGGPVIEIGLGRTDGSQVAPPHRLPGGYEGATMLKTMFARMGLSQRDLVALTGAHTLGFTQRKPFTGDPWVFSNSFFTQLVELKGSPLLQTDTAMLEDPELRPYVELYAQDADQFWEDFADAYRRMSWLGYDGAVNS
jgi:L-ascorbate peroxidase